MKLFCGNEIREIEVVSMTMMVVMMVMDFWNRMTRGVFGGRIIFAMQKSKQLIDAINLSIGGERENKTQPVTIFLHPSSTLLTIQ